MAKVITVKEVELRWDSDWPAHAEGENGGLLSKRAER